MKDAAGIALCVLGVFWAGSALLRAYPLLVMGSGGALVGLAFIAVAELLPAGLLVWYGRRLLREVDHGLKKN